MTSEEIKQRLPTDLSSNGWLREIAIQVALLNEKVIAPEVGTVVETPSEHVERVKRAYTKRKPK